MIFDTPAAHGSLVNARQNKSVYLILVLCAFVIAVFFCFWFILRAIKQKHQTKEWIEAQKKHLTKYSDVKKVAQQLKLSHAEAELLWQTCRNEHALNIQYLVHDADALYLLFQTAFNSMKAQHLPEAHITSLFDLLSHIENALASSVTITSTTAITEGTPFTIILPNGIQCPCSLLKNSPDGLLLEIPRQLYDSPDRPRELSKTIFLFVFSKSQIHCTFVSRVIRYQIGIDNKLGMLVAHSNDIKMQIKRECRRIVLDKNSKFSAVDAVKVNGRETYKPRQKEYDCVVANISGKGCCIHTSLPIKENQLLFVKIPVAALVVTAVGKIVSTRKINDSEFALHIDFTQIDPLYANALFAYVYHFDTNTPQR